ncbi:ATP-binding protein [Pseudonocardia lacus]|uniref:ATP-binding protein n=1 Tax=Pseudonocardia lacus TaxID=2835865 RepID=UPI001BDC7A31|nr:BTAD domain-containing putative transcriptional regulator [Pseudonocardia lacus]
MDFSVLGPLQVSAHGSPVPVRPGLPRALLVLLLTHPRTPVPVDVVAERLWADSPPADVANSVHRLVSYLRRALGAEGAALLVSRAPGYALAVADSAIDAHRFTELVGAATTLAGAGTALGAHRALEHTAEALALWRGEPLADVATRPWAAPEVARLQELHLQLHEARLEALLALGRDLDVIAAARPLVADNPLRERLHASLVLALYRAGRQGDALDAYQAARRVLARELGLDPGPRLRLLERQVLAQDDALRWRPPADSHPPTTSAGPPPGPDRPPMPPTGLVGRREHLADLHDLLDRARLVTLTGPGGAGKTRLALELARSRGSDPVWFVDLSLLQDDRLVAASAARAVGAATATAEDPHDAVVRRIGATAGLLVLDNCEHVIDAAAGLAKRLRDGCPALVLLATSRRPLRVAGEVVWPVPPLPLPPSGATTPGEVRDVDAVRLFTERASAVRPGFAVTDDNAADVAAIVEALDGLPLAIELAAAHADVLTPRGIRSRLDDHFELLESDSREAPARHRTLRAAIRSGVDLLDERERRFFAELGAFAGSFDLDAAAAVTATSSGQCYRSVASLVRQSLVVPTADDRYRLLHSLRAYAAEALAAQPWREEVRRRHFDHVFALVAAADGGLRSAEQAGWLRRLSASLPDLRAALRWALDGGAPGRGARLAVTAHWFWMLEGMLDEAEHWLERAVPGTDDDAVRAALLHAIGRIAAPRGDLRKAHETCLRSAELSRRIGDDRIASGALVTLGLVRWAMGELPGAAAAHDEAAERAEACGDMWHRTAALILRARTAVDADEDDADDRIAAALAAARPGRDNQQMGLAMSQVARRALLTGDPTAAATAARECLSLWRSVGYREGEIHALTLLGRAATAMGDAAEAGERAREALGVAAAIGHRGGLCDGVGCLAGALHAAGADEEALTLLTVADAERRRVGIPVPAADAPPLADLADQVRRRLGPRADAISARARDRTIDDVVGELPTPPTSTPTPFTAVIPT